MPDSSANPLPPCPGAPNCVRTSRSYGVAPDALFQAARQALDALGPSETTVQADARRAAAVYRVALVFKDDVQIAVTPSEDGSALHIRSESRVGYEDLGVNKRRVDRFFQALESHL